VAAVSLSLWEDLVWRGLVHQATDAAELAVALSNQRVCAYQGFDPTADSLGIGNLQGIVTLMRLQRAGHRPIVLAGGGTGLIGDPSDKAEERLLLSREQLDLHLSGIRSQLGRFLDFSSGAGESAALLLDNATWLEPLRLIEFLREVGKHFTVNAMMNKEAVRARLTERERGISYAEFSYMLLQAYDFLRLFDDYGCRLQLGGSDQWGNITLGVELIRRLRDARAWGLTSPLITNRDGTKFGKTEEGNVWLDPRRTSPYAMWQFFVRVPDDEVGRLLRVLTFLAREEIEALDAATAKRPQERRAQRALARDVTSLVHGEAEEAAAERAAAVLFTEEIAGLSESMLLEVLADAPRAAIPVSTLEGSGLGIVEALVRAGLEASNGAARRTVAQSGAYLNNRRVSSPEAVITKADLLHGQYAILRKGKATHCLLRFA